MHTTAILLPTPTKMSVKWTQLSQQQAAVLAKLKSHATTLTYCRGQFGIKNATFYSHVDTK